MSYTRVYWRPSDVPTGALVLLALVAVLCLIAVENMRQQENIRDYGVMVAAARQAQQSMEYVAELRKKIQRIDVDVDPQESGLIGVSSSPVTSLTGHLAAKQTTVNPNWASVVIDMLREAGVKKGDVVAVAASGSFPALNIAIYTALEQIEAVPIVIVSGSASQWGANVPGLLWLDMERELRNAGHLQTRAVAISLGGAEDRGIGISDRGKQIIRVAIERYKADMLFPANLDEAVAKRIAIYSKYAKDQPIKAYINVGGGTASTGPAAIDQYFDSGLIRSAAPKAFAMESVTGHFLKQDVPVLNFSGIATIASRYGLPISPQVKQPIGSGGVYETTGYRRWLAAACIVFILVMIYVVTRISGVVLAFAGKRDDPQQVRPTI